MTSSTTRRVPVPPVTSRPANATPARGSTPSWESLNKLLECTVCFETMEGSIFQCEEGHCLCNECWTRLAVDAERGCPTCAAPLGHIRCRFAEEIREKCLRNGELQHHRKPIGNSGTQNRQSQQVPRMQSLKIAANKLGVTIDDLRSVMVREGVGLADAVALAARQKVASSIEAAGGIASYEKQRRELVADFSPSRDKTISSTPPRDKKETQTPSALKFLSERRNEQRRDLLNESLDGVGRRGVGVGGGRMQDGRKRVLPAGRKDGDVKMRAGEGGKVGNAGGGQGARHTQAAAEEEDVQTLFLKYKEEVNRARKEDLGRSEEVGGASDQHRSIAQHEPTSAVGVQEACGEHVLKHAARPPPHTAEVNLALPLRDSNQTIQSTPTFTPSTTSTSSNNQSVCSDALPTAADRPVPNVVTAGEGKPGAASLRGSVTMVEYREFSKLVAKKALAKAKGHVDENVGGGSHGTAGCRGDVADAGEGSGTGENHAAETHDVAGVGKGVDPESCEGGKLDASGFSECSSVHAVSQSSSLDRTIMNIANSSGVNGENSASNAFGHDRLVTDERLAVKEPNGAIEANENANGNTCENTISSVNAQQAKSFVGPGKVGEATSRAVVDVRDGSVDSAHNLAELVQPATTVVGDGFDDEVVQSSHAQVQASGDIAYQDAREGGDGCQVESGGHPHSGVQGLVEALARAGSSGRGLISEATTHDMVKTLPASEDALSTSPVSVPKLFLPVIVPAQSAHTCVPPYGALTDRPASSHSFETNLDVRTGAISHRITRAHAPLTARVVDRRDGARERDVLVDAVDSVRRGDRSGGGVWRIVAGVRKRLRLNAMRQM